MPKINRRSFVGLTIMGTAAAALELPFLRPAQAGEPDYEAGSVSRTTGRVRQAIPSVCLQCSAACGILGYVEEDRLVKIGGNPKHPNSRGRICAKGQAGINALYDPHRILYPLRRIGGRGEGKWKRISWDEALDELTTRLGELQEKADPSGFVFQMGTNGAPPLARRFVKAFGTSSVVQVPSYGANKRIGLALTCGADMEINDVARSRYILNFGSNPYEAHVYHNPIIQRIIDAKIAGAKMVTFDVRLSHTAAKSDEWFPVVPGTDAIVALSMANVIMRKGIYDREFVERWTNYPAADLEKHLAGYEPSLAEEISGVRAADIERIAIEFATTRPGTTISGSGVSMHYNGVQNERAVALLNAITGNVDVPGGWCLPQQYLLPEPDPIPPGPTAPDELAHPSTYPLATYTIGERTLLSIRERRQKVGVYMTYMHNPVYSNPQTALNAEVLKNEELIPFHVSVDVSMSEGAALADLILPDTTYLEKWELLSTPSFELIPFVALRQPIVEPRGEATCFQNICIELGKRLGGDVAKYMDFRSAEHYTQTMAGLVPGVEDVGSWESLQQDGVWSQQHALPGYQSYERNGFATDSGRFEVYSRRLAEAGFNPLPAFEPIPDHRQMSIDDLYLTTFKYNVQTSRSANCKWLSEIAHSNDMWMHPETAQARGLNKGDAVRLISSLGSREVRVRTTHAIHPRVVAVSGGLGHTGLGSVARAEKSETDDPDTRLVWWEENGVNPNEIIALRFDPIGGGQAWMDTKVTIARA